MLQKDAWAKNTIELRLRITGEIVILYLTRQDNRITSGLRTRPFHCISEALSQLLVVGCDGKRMPILADCYASAAFNIATPSS